jgi:hypothetical protein
MSSRNPTAFFHHWEITTEIIPWANPVKNGSGYSLQSFAEKSKRISTAIPFAIHSIMLPLLVRFSNIQRLFKISGNVTITLSFYFPKISP